MTTMLDLSSDILTDEHLDQMTRDLLDAVHDLDDVAAQAATRAPQTGDKGALATIGKLLLDFTGTSAAGELIKVLGAFFNRETSLEGKITFADGTVIEVNARNLNQDDFQQRLGAMIQATQKD